MSLGAPAAHFPLKANLEEQSIYVHELYMALCGLLFCIDVLLINQYAEEWSPELIEEISAFPFSDFSMR